MDIGLAIYEITDIIRSQTLTLLLNNYYYFKHT